MSSTHNHSHEHVENISLEEVIALLSYMIEHNKHHEEELLDLSHNMDSEAFELVNKAVDDFRKGNSSLTKALDILKNNSGE